MTVPFQYPQGRISLVNSGKQPDYLCTRQLVGYSCSALEWHLCRGLWKCSFTELDPVRRCWVSKRKTKVLVCIGLQLHVDGSA